MLQPKVSVIRLGTGAYFGKKVKTGGIHLIIALIWRHKFPVMMSQLPCTALQTCLAQMSEMHKAFIYFFKECPTFFINIGSNHCPVSRIRLKMSFYWNWFSKHFWNIWGPILNPRMKKTKTKEKKPVTRLELNLADKWACDEHQELFFTHCKH